MKLYWHPFSIMPWRILMADACYASLVLVLARAGLADEVAARRGLVNWVSRLSKRSSIVETMMRSADR